MQALYITKSYISNIQHPVQSGFYVNAAPTLIKLFLSGLHSEYPWKLFWAEDGTRTRNPHHGKVVLYQLSYFRIKRAFN